VAILSVPRPRAAEPARPWRLATLRRSPLARRIVATNLVGLALLVAGVLHLDPFREGLVLQRERTLLTEARLVAVAVEARGLGAALDGLALPERTDVALYDGDGRLAAASPGAPEMPQALVAAALAGRIGTDVVETVRGSAFRAAVPLSTGALVLSSASGVLDDLARSERDAVLRLFALAIAASIGLGLVLATTIAGPIAELARAADEGRGGSGAKVRIPDLTRRRDEIGRLSGALRGLVGNLVERVDAEERFAADVAHEIKNPLASLGSAVGALRRATPDQREQLFGVIEHDLRRLDRLVSDISNASRLDGELVREADAPFDLAALLTGLVQHLGLGAGERGVALDADLPPGPVMVRGREERLAQVFVNLIDNAVSFCGPGAGVRVRLEARPGAVTVTVEDGGPGIPDAALERIFERFYSERPEGQFGDNSGLGLAISRQIVEAHGGVIEAQNIRGEDGTVRGARLVVTLPA
jgi:two-component system sensor histidine kinase ChvG